MADRPNAKGPGAVGGLAAYRREWLRPDLVAGLTAAAVVVPMAMAYATVAGLPVQVGLYTALVPMVLYALLGTSRPLSVSTTSTLAVLSAAALAEAAPGGEPAALVTATATLALLVGAFLSAAALLRLGFIANFISESVLVGFKAGIGLVILLAQLPKLLGVSIEKEGFFRDILSTLRALPEASVPTLALGAATVLGLLALGRLLPKVPGPLIAVGAGIAAMRFSGLESLGVAAVGQVPPGLPGLTLPDLTLFAALWPAALGIALMSFTESIAAARAFAGGDEPPPRPNWELLSLAVANAGGSLFGAMPAGGGTSQTAVNRLAGARTQMAQGVTAAGTLLTLLFLAPLIGLMPQATLAAVVTVSAAGLVRFGDFRAILRVRRMEFTWAVVAFLGVVFLGTLKGILAAILVSLAGLVRQLTAPAVFEVARIPGTDAFRRRSPDHPGDETFPGLLMVRILDRIFFANAEYIGARVRELAEGPSHRVLALDLTAVPDLEYTALKMLVRAVGRARARGVTIWLVGLNPAVKEVVLRSDLVSALGQGTMHRNLECAVVAYLAAGEAPPAASAQTVK